MQGYILIISGWRGVGKTTLCDHLVFAARRSNWDVAGLLSPVHIVGDKKTEIIVESIRSGVRRILARQTRFGENTFSSLTPAWVFDPDQLAWGNMVLRDALPCDLLVIDELGPLELLSDGGWQAGTVAIDKRDYRLALIVIRPELLEIACWRWKQAEIIILETAADIPSVAERVTQRFFRLPLVEGRAPETDKRFHHI